MVQTEDVQRVKVKTAKYQVSSTLCRECMEWCNRRAELGTILNGGSMSVSLHHKKLKGGEGLIM